MPARRSDKAPGRGDTSPKSVEECIVPFSFSFHVHEYEYILAVMQEEELDTRMLSMCGSPRPVKSFSNHIYRPPARLGGAIPVVIRGHDNARLEAVPARGILRCLAMRCG